MIKIPLKHKYKYEKVYVKLTEDEAKRYGLSTDKQYEGMFNWVLYDYEKVIMVRGCRTWVDNETSEDENQYCIDSLTQTFFNDMEEYVDYHMYFSFRQLLADKIFPEHIPADVTANIIV